MAYIDNSQLSTRRALSESNAFQINLEKKKFARNSIGIAKPKDPSNIILEPRQFSWQSERKSAACTLEYSKTSRSSSRQKTRIWIYIEFFAFVASFIESSAAVGIARTRRAARRDLKGNERRRSAETETIFINSSKNTSTPLLCNLALREFANSPAVSSFLYSFWLRFFFTTLKKLENAKDRAARKSTQHFFQNLKK